MKKICLINVYFGKWPRWMNIFFKACGYNPTINWLIYTDCDTPKNHPNNVKFIKGNLEGFNRLATKKLKIKSKIINVYKICDFKPTFGVIFSDYLKNYDYWGYSDIDLIYGNIRNILDKNSFEEYDVISSLKHYTTGHFTLYKNNKKNNNLFRKCFNYKEVLQSDKTYGFDESNQVKTKIQIIPHRIILKNKPDCMAHLVIKLKIKKKLKILLKKMIEEDNDIKPKVVNKKFNILWKNGDLINKKNNEKLLYFHFIISKSRPYFYITPWKEVPEEFCISNIGIYKNKKSILFKIFLIRSYYLPFIITDRLVGKIGIEIKKISPKTYLSLKKIKDRF